ncbi:hypothetical protein [Sunxiuqinia indica]|uniref:hypothetical protein n=1 Tax=Sunxiuqinia indica TaxID=2692584 RepID=UPI00135BA77F|nr:hypothetical protein [Sunxiuqinia indica]
MKRSEELRIEKTQKIERMQAIVAAAEKEKKRSLTDDEQAEWDRLDGEVRSLTTEIQRAERMEELGQFTSKKTKSQRQDTDTDDDDDPTQHQRDGKGPFIKREAKVYNLGKAMKEYTSARGDVSRLTGLEKETQDEMARGISSDGLLIPNNVFKRAATSNTTTNAGSIDVQIAGGLSVLDTEAALYRQMGLTILEGLQGTFKVGAKAKDVAGKYAEGATVTETGNKATFKTMAPERYGITDTQSKELLVQENPEVHMAYLNDMMRGCDRKITAEIYAVALAAATEVAGVDLTDPGFLSLMKSVNAGGGAFAMNRNTFFDAQGVKVDTGSGKFLTSMNGDDNGVGTTHRGTRAYYHDLFADGANQQYLLYGIWAEIWLGMWGATEVLFNPFSYQKEAEIEITVNKLAKAVSRNDAAFVKSPDLDPAA